MTRTFAGYTCEDRVSSGFYGDTFGAVGASGKRANMLVLADELAESKVFREALEENARTLTLLSHDCVESTIAIGDASDGSLVVLTEAVSGATQLASLLSGRAMPTSAALTILTGVVEALGFAHGLGMAHGAVHARSVTVDDKGRVRLGHFAVAAAFATAATRLSAVSERRQNRGRFAPELKKGIEPTAQSDVFEVGALAIELITGGSFRSDFSVGENVDRILKRTIATDPAMRPTDGNDLSQLLLDGLRHDGLTTLSNAELWRSLAPPIERAGTAALAGETEELLASLGLAADDNEPVDERELDTAVANVDMAELGQALEGLEQPTKLSAPSEELIEASLPTAVTVEAPRDGTIDGVNPLVTPARRRGLTDLLGDLDEVSGAHGDGVEPDRTGTDSLAGITRVDDRESRASDPLSGMLGPVRVPTDLDAVPTTSTTPNTADLKKAYPTFANTSAVAPPRDDPDPRPSVKPAAKPGGSFTPAAPKQGGSFTPAAPRSGGSFTPATPRERVPPRSSAPPVSPPTPTPTPPADVAELPTQAPTAVRPQDQAKPVAVSTPLPRNRSTSRPPPRARGSNSQNPLEIELFGSPQKSSRRLIWVAVISLVIGVTAAAIYTQTDIFHPERAKKRAEFAEKEREALIRTEKDKLPTIGEVRIDAGDTSGAAVWYLIGRTPVTSIKVPSGQVHNLRFEHDGYQTSDVVVSRSHWTGQGDKARASLSVTLGVGESNVGAYPPEPPVRPAPGPKGAGPIEIKSNPAGAEVWLLIGFTPGVSFTGIESGRDYEFRVQKDGFRPAYAVVRESDWWVSGKGGPLKTQLIKRVEVKPIAGKQRR